MPESVFQSDPFTNIWAYPKNSHKLPLKLVPSKHVVNLGFINSGLTVV